MVVRGFTGSSYDWVCLTVSEELREYKIGEWIFGGKGEGEKGSGGKEEGPGWEGQSYYPLPPPQPSYYRLPPPQPSYYPLPPTNPPITLFSLPTLLLPSSLPTLLITFPPTN
jgi:hypothetical protein